MFWKYGGKSSSVLTDLAFHIGPLQVDPRLRSSMPEPQKKAAARLLPAVSVESLKTENHE